MLSARTTTGMTLSSLSVRTVRLLYANSCIAPIVLAKTWWVKKRCQSALQVNEKRNPTKHWCTVYTSYSAPWLVTKISRHSLNQLVAVWYFPLLWLALVKINTTQFWCSDIQYYDFSTITIFCTSLVCSGVFNNRIKALTAPNCSSLRSKKLIVSKENTSYWGEFDVSSFNKSVTWPLTVFYLGNCFSVILVMRSE